MVDFDRGYFPFFFNWVDMTRMLSDGELGLLVRAMCEHFRDGTERELPREIMTAYLFMVDGARRAVEHQKSASARAKENASARWKKEPPKNEYINFDVDEAFSRALERSYGKPEESAAGK